MRGRRTLADEIDACSARPGPQLKPAVEKVDLNRARSWPDMPRLKTLLIVDDDQGMRDTLTAILKRDYRDARGRERRGRAGRRCAATAST